MSKIKFLKTAARDYRVGALTRSSPYVVQKIIKEIEPSYAYLVEYGAGDGVITRHLLGSLPPDGKLVAVETNDDFIRELETIGDKRFTAVHDDVQAVSKQLFKLPLPRIDAVISGIPFSFLRRENRIEIVRNTYHALHENGKFILYQHSPLMFPILKRHFRHVRISFEPRNFLPYFIMVGKKSLTFRK